MTSSVSVFERYTKARSQARHFHAYLYMLEVRTAMFIMETRAFLNLFTYALLVLSTPVRSYHGGVVAARLGRRSTALFASSRRTFLTTATTAASASASAWFVVLRPATAATATVPLSELLSLVKEARLQLDGVPALIETEKWDSVRAILIRPPLSDCWAKTARPLLTQYAQAIENAHGDELAALEAKEEVISHLRYLDMAVYNNNFNPIKSEGTSGATKELVRSYYEDPTNEWKASVQALDELIQLARI
jgi:hypothetical protein